VQPAVRPFEALALVPGSLVGWGGSRDCAKGLCDGTSALSKNEHYLPRARGNFRGYDMSHLQIISATYGLDA
jgi:hypothetical protein